MKKLGRICGICLILAFLAGCGRENLNTQDAGNIVSLRMQETDAQAYLEEEYNERSSEVSTALAMTGRDVKTGNSATSTDGTKADDTQADGTKADGTKADGTKADGTNADSTNMANAADNSETGNDEETADAEETAADAEEPEIRELTGQELRKLQWSVRSSDNGFFVCHYYRPEEIDWEQVFYNGAGMGITLSDDQVALIRETLRTKRIEEERIKAELMGIEPEEDEEPQEYPFTEEELSLNAGKITALTLRSIQNFVKSRTGLDYSEARKPLEWPEVSRNLKYFIHDDSNAIRVEFMSGTVCGNEYEIAYRRAVWSREKKPEFIMTVRIENGKWNFISNLPIDEASPKTLADIEFYSSKELARMSGTLQMIEVPELPEEEDPYEELNTNNKKNQKKDPVYYWAVITAREDGTRICLDRTYHGDEISKELLEKRIYLPGENLYEISLQAGEKIGIKVSLDDVPKLRIRVTCGAYYGDYAFGSENHLKRFTKEGMPLSTYVYGRDCAGERRGTEYSSEKELLRFLEGDWIFYDSEMGEYTAIVSFDLAGNMVIRTLGNTYVLQIFGYDRIYTDSRSDPPDVIKLKSVDEETLEIFTQYYSFLKKKVGDYRIRAVQMDGEQMVLLSFENTGKDGLSYLLPGADLLADDIALYRFVGTEVTEN